jgi:hypothetical protein
MNLLNQKPASLPDAPAAEQPPLEGRVVVLAREGNITAGVFEVNDAFDLTLYQMPDGHFEVVVFMKLQFFFKSGPGGHWTDAEQQTYVGGWRDAVLRAWSGRNIHRTGCGRNVSMRLDFEIQCGGWMRDHWEISVIKIPAGDFRHSYVNVHSGNVALDSEDLTPANKGDPQLQRGVVHEFGHMLGLEDEYEGDSSHQHDRASVMNFGESIRERHHEPVRSWVIRKLRDYGLL